MSEPSGAPPDYADLFEHAPAGYLLLDASGRIERINQAGAAMLGWDATWLAGKSFSRWVVDSDRPSFVAHQHNTRRDGCTTHELRLKNRQGRIVPVRLESVRGVDDASGNAGCRCIMIDVTGEQQSARELRRLQSQLTHVARVNTAGELASSLAHELNQPLGTVVLNCDAALRLLHDGATQEYEFAETLAQAREAASFASDVIRHLRGFLAKDGGLQTACVLRELIQDVATLIRADARDNGMELQLDIGSALPPVRVDAVQIEQVLLNLARNSIEAMRENGDGPMRVTITARQVNANRIRVSVADTGPGLEPRQVNRLFTPFFTTKNNGMGMGLSISRTIIEAHGGQLWAAPESGDGATLHFTLPTIEDARRGD